jgi:hypothetical protein
LLDDVLRARPASSAVTAADPERVAADSISGGLRGIGTMRAVEAAPTTADS